MMTFHESYGHLPMRLLRAYKRFNVSPADHDGIMAAFGIQYAAQESIPADVWGAATKFVEASSTTGMYRAPFYM